MKLIQIANGTWLSISAIDGFVVSPDGVNAVKISNEGGQTLWLIAKVSAVLGQKVANKIALRVVQPGFDMLSRGNIGDIVNEVAQ